MQDSCAETTYLVCVCVCVLTVHIDLRQDFDDKQLGGDN